MVIATGASVMLWQNRLRGFAGARHPHGRACLTVDVPDGFLEQNSTPPSSPFATRCRTSRASQAMAWSMDVPGRSLVKTYRTIGRGPGLPNLDANAMPVDLGFFDVYGVHVVAGRLRAPTVAAAAPASAAWHRGKPRNSSCSMPARRRLLGFPTPESAVDQVIFAGGEPTSRARTGCAWWPWSSRCPARGCARGAAARTCSRSASKPQPVLTLKGPDMAAAAGRRARLAALLSRRPARPAAADEAVARPTSASIASRRWPRDDAAGTAAVGLRRLRAGRLHGRRRAREIVVRKLYGAGPARIAGLLAREFAPLLAVAAALGAATGRLARPGLAGELHRTLHGLPLGSAPPARAVAMIPLRQCGMRMTAMNMRPTQALRN